MNSRTAFKTIKTSLYLETIEESGIDWDFIDKNKMNGLRLLKSDNHTSSGLLYYDTKGKVFKKLRSVKTWPNSVKEDLEVFKKFNRTVYVFGAFWA